MEETKNISVTKIIEEVCDEICSNYCKWPILWDGSQGELCER